MNKNLLAIVTILAALTACNLGSGSSGGATYPTVNVGMVCNPNESQTIPYGESFLITASLPGPTTATITFLGNNDSDQWHWSALTCQIVNGTSCSVSFTNLNTSGITAPTPPVSATSPGYNQGGCVGPTMLSK